MVRLRRRRKDRGYWPAVVLFIVAVVLSIVSFDLLPSDSSPPTPGSFAFVVEPQAATKILDVSVYETQSSGRYQVSISATIPAGDNGDIYVDGYYPNGDRLLGCSPERCERFPNDILNMAFDMPSPTSAQSTSGYSFPEEHLTFAGTPVGFASNSLEATAALPQIEVPLTVLQQQGTVGSVSVSYDIPHAPSYDWDSGLHPVSVEGGWVTWYLPLQSAGSSFSSSPGTASGVSDGSFSSVSAQVGAVNNALQARNTRFTFFGGALLGVAGGALVGAVQEALDAREKEDEEKDEEREAQQPHPAG